MRLVENGVAGKPCQAWRSAADRAEAACSYIFVGKLSWTTSWCPLPLPETELIERVRRLSNLQVTRRSSPDRAHPHLLAGIGDDCAVLHLPSRHDALVTTD